MIQQFLSVADPIGRGCGSFAHLCLGFPAMGGLAYPFVAGGFVLRRRRLYPDVGPWTVCGSAAPDATTITNSDGFAHETEMAYQYAASRVLGNGFGSAFSEPVRVDFDDAGEVIVPPLPMFPVRLTAAPTSGGRFALQWEYDPFGHGAWPTDFQVFAGPDAASVDYDSPLIDDETGLDVVRVAGTQRAFAFTTQGYSEGTTRVFGVRGRNAGGVAERNTRTTPAVDAMESVGGGIAAIGLARQGRP